MQRPGDDTQRSRDPGEALRRRATCRICDGPDLIPLFSLGRTPLANGLVRQEDLAHQEPHFPLDLHMCTGCAHVQLLDVVDPAVLFRDYVYVSGTSATFVQHFRAYAEDAAQRLSLPDGAFVVDVGSNDGTLLRFFQAKGCRVLGVDPAVDIARTATANGIETIAEFFAPDLADQIVSERGPADLVVANNVFAHVDDLLGFVQSVDRLLAPGGSFVFEVSYLVDVHEKTLFDTIYHEHLSYHTVGPLRRLFERAGMELFDAVRVSSHGGSLRGFARRIGASRQAATAVHGLAQYEEEMGFYRPDTFRELYARIQSRKQELRSILEGLRTANKRVAGYGAPAKATTLMHAFGIDSNAVEYIVEDNPLKQGLFTPGFHIPIVAPDKLREDPPDYLLLLAWNFADPIRARYREYAERGGRFIVPLPNVEVH
jgi:SAM-dependent methyltransferase